MTLKPENADQYLAFGCGRCAFGGTPQCKVQSWVEELRLLRTIVLESGLNEVIKWGVPTYTHGGKNILTLSALKGSATLSFFRGAELNDPERILEKPGENSRFARYIRFTDSGKIPPLKGAIHNFIKETIRLEESGKSAKPIHDVMLEYPAELVDIFKANPEFEAAFHALTPGRQRGYLIHFTSAKQSKTKTARINKCMPKILKGKGWNERI